MKKECDELLSIVLNNYNVDLSIFNESYLRKTIDSYISKNNIESITTFLSSISSDKLLFFDFYNELFNGYSMFMRESSVYHYLIHYYKANPSLLNEEIRVWSLGCSKGHEAYSFAILFEELREELNIDINYLIFGTDKLLEHIQHANNGIYSKNDIRNLTLEQIDTYFIQENESYRILERLKNNITFSTMDIVLDKDKYPKESVYGSFDIVICSNLIIYYNEQVQSDVLDKIYESTKEKGLILTSKAEIEFFETVLKEERDNVYIPVIKKTRR